jgi:Mlc titration factor MtfA (ptsG expression regulator)
MPFDTTYHLYSIDCTTEETVIMPGGGRDTDIYLVPGQLPGNSKMLNMDSLVSIIQANSPHKVLKQHEDGYTPGPVFISIFVGILIFIAVKARREAKDYRPEPLQTFLADNDFDENTTVQKKPAVLTYYGDELKFTNEQYATILTNHFPYYNALTEEEKTIFIHRVDNFINNKVFKIHSAEAFREMPVLISAAAIQLTFGLKKYLLTNFEFIHIFPQEFMRVQPVLCFLEGNVSGHTINLSWKHFLEGIQHSGDGKNVGLHEMSHALYYQTFVTEENIDYTFRDCFNEFNSTGNKVYDTEMINEEGLYSDYAMKNFQEFWAESVELFFEKPLDMKRAYPSLYDAIADVLNQDPATKLSAQT